VRLFLFRVRRDDAHGGSLKGRAPTVGAWGDDALDENRWAKTGIFKYLGY